MGWDTGRDRKVVVNIWTANESDWPAIWPIWHVVVAAGETYVWSPDTGYDEARRLWMLPPPAEVLVAANDEAEQGGDSDAEGGEGAHGGGAVVGSALVKPNHPGLGSHVANAGFMVDPAVQGQGVGRLLGEAVLDRARNAGYEAMQFNAVVSTNHGAIHLWKSLGFEVVGTVPRAFRHAREGLVDLLVMYREL